MSVSDIRPDRQAIIAWRAALGRWKTRFRGPLLTVAILVFGICCIYSLMMLDLEAEDIRLVPLLLLLFALVPLQTCYGAANMVLMGAAAKVRFGFVDGVRTNVFAQLAELLPIPGGAIVRTAALMDAGGKAGSSAGLVLAFSLLWISVAAFGAGAILTREFPLASLLAGAGLASALLTYLWLARRYGHAIAGVAIGLRVLGVLIVAARLLACFAAIGIAVPTLSGIIFAFATILGSAAALVPAGLAVGEGLSALMAAPLGVAPAAAFLAAAFNRIAGLGINFLLAVVFAIADRKRISKVAALDPTPHKCGTR